MNYDLTPGWFEPVYRETRWLGCNSQHFHLIAGNLRVWIEQSFWCFWFLNFYRFQASTFSLETQVTLELPRWLKGLWDRHEMHKMREFKWKSATKVEQKVCSFEDISNFPGFFHDADYRRCFCVNVVGYLHLLKVRRCGRFWFFEMSCCFVRQILPWGLHHISLQRFAGTTLTAWRHVGVEVEWTAGNSPETPQQIRASAFCIWGRCLVAGRSALWDVLFEGARDKDATWSCLCNLNLWIWRTTVLSRCRFRPVIFQQWPCKFAPWTSNHSQRSSASRKKFRQTVGFRESFNFERILKKLQFCIGIVDQSLFQSFLFAKFWSRYHEASFILVMFVVPRSRPACLSSSAFAKGLFLKLLKNER